MIVLGNTLPQRMLSIHVSQYCLVLAVDNEFECEQTKQLADDEKSTIAQNPGYLACYTSG